MRIVLALTRSLRIFLSRTHLLRVILMPFQLRHFVVLLQEGYRRHFRAPCLRRLLLLRPRRTSSLQSPFYFHCGGVYFWANYLLPGAPPFL